MNHPLGRFAFILVLAGLLVAGMGVVTAETAMAQGPCGPGIVFTQPFDTGSVPVTTALFRSDTSTQPVPANCNSYSTWSHTYDAFEYQLIGPGPHEMTAETCANPGAYYNAMYLYQAPGGAAGAFNPGSVCTNLVAYSQFQACAFGTRLTSTTLEEGFYTIVIGPWLAQQASLAGDIEIEAPTCGPFKADDFVTTLDSPTGNECVQSGDRLVGTVQFTNVSDITIPDVTLTGVYRPAFIGISCSSTHGPCNSGAGGFDTTGDVPPGETVTVNYVVQIRGGTPADAELCVDLFLEYDPSGGEGERITLEFGVCSDIPACPPTVSPNLALAGQVHLPIMNFQGQNDVCRTWLEVQNVGSEFSKAALVVWGEPGFCPPQCSGPLKVECSGLLKPGSTWNFIYPQVPNGSKSGILFSFTARQLSQIGDPLGFDDIVADVLCETLFFNVVGDCDDYRRFKKAYNEGLVFAGIPLDRAYGSPLAVEVLRHCPGDETPGAEVSSKYAGIAGIDLGAYDPVFGGYAYYVPLLYAESSDLNSVMYIQNGGLECSSIEIWFKAQDDCLRARICEIFTLAPGETYQFDSNDCVGPDFQGNAWLRSSQPMGIAVDIFGRDILMTYVGVPTELNYTFNPDDATFTTGNQVAYGPLIYSEYQGWDTGVQVQNMSSVVAAKVKVYFLDRSGDVITTLVDWICPRGSQTYFLPVVADLPGTWVGSLRVESQEWFSPGDPLVLPPNITGIVTLIKYTDAARSDTAEAIAYNLLTEQRAYDWQVGCCGGGTDSGIGLIAIPSVLKDIDNTGVTAELAIANLVPKPGFTDFAIYIYDQNGLLDYVCQKLNEKQVEYIDFNSWGYLNPGFKGSAIISATFWEHDMFDEQGLFIRNLLGLAAVIVERTGTHLGEDIPGDEAAGTAGIPFRESDVEDEEFSFDFEGPVAPLCPGQPGGRPPPGACDANTLFDQSYQFNMTVQQSIALTHPCPDPMCDTGPAWVNRAWDIEPLIVTIDCPATLTATMTALSIPPFPGFSIVNLMLYNAERSPADHCLNMLDSTSKNVGNQFQGMFQAVGDSYTFVERDSCDILVLPAGTYWLYAHVSASFSGGTVDVDLDFSAP
jgi:hypothetical protein